MQKMIKNIFFYQDISEYLLIYAKKLNTKTNENSTMIKNYIKNKFVAQFNFSKYKWNK